VIWLLACLLQSEATIKVYIYDKDKRLLSLKDVDCRVILEIDGVGRKMLETERVESDQPAGRKHHGGDVEDSEGYFVEVVIDETLKDDDPHVRARTALQGLACPMRCEFIDKAGPCPKCAMKVGPQPYHFTAVVVFRINGVPRNVRVRVPPPAGTYKEAVESLEKEVQKLSQTDRTEPIFKRIGELTERLKETAPEAARTDIVRLASEVEELAESKGAYESYKPKLEALKKFVR
jgi:hypothetical protein